MMDNDNAQAIANALRAFHRMGIISAHKLDKIIDRVQIMLWEYDTKAP